MWQRVRQTVNRCRNCFVRRVACQFQLVGTRQAFEAALAKGGFDLILSDFPRRDLMA